MKAIDVLERRMSEEETAERHGAYLKTMEAFNKELADALAYEILQMFIQDGALTVVHSKAHDALIERHKKISREVFRSCFGFYPPTSTAPPSPAAPES